MTKVKKERRDAAVIELLGRGCVLEKKEDRFGDTKSGWWQDGVWLGPKSDPEYCLRVLMGN